MNILQKVYCSIYSTSKHLDLKSTYLKATGAVSAIAIFILLGTLFLLFAINPDLLPTVTSESNPVAASMPKTIGKFFVIILFIAVYPIAYKSFSFDKYTNLIQEFEEYDEFDQEAISKDCQMPIILGVIFMIISVGIFIFRMAP